ncbi:2-succinyl-5-enolpyruvyl-6-hydroxy-3-cyclohexene-1-carboxylic-acid synthase [Ekhidna sp. MALMAid0563]|uniref:2-succinyl-5-enolpyruvyl-6-hydroxy-3- cyclohexene-1-carboxylic-acid synthase n=1 Tax=Ekhidna sp. MALMAid0563 TaxID=3143937 RepID=UPI0032DEBEAB
MLHPTVFNTSQICHQLGVRYAVMSPGSRNAPLTISFARHEGIKKYIIPDERSAGFVALGIAQETKTPVVLCCTSGSALLNYAPAIAEAYYREIPLIVLSADRPPELIDQRDGQTIRQFEALKNHVKGSVNLPLVSTEAEAKNYSEMLIKALQEATTLPLGPVHINTPFKEPFYPEAGQALEFEKVEMDDAPDSSLSRELNTDLTPYKKVLILVGQKDPDQELEAQLKPIADLVPVLRSPLNNLQVGIQHVDGFISSQKELQPDLLITTGLSVLSKKLKQYLRSHPPKAHFHFDPAGIEVDTFQSSPRLIKESLSSFLKRHSFDHADSKYLEKWKAAELKARQALDTFKTQKTFSESSTTFQVLETLPDNSTLHLSNSMPVRYADLFGVKNTIQTYCNRGTSGIDGCTSTAIGTSMVSDRMNVLLTGDLAFLYDRNAFFHNYPLPNLRVIVLNNQGGGIFRLIDGPANLPELEEYFETRHNRTAEYICTESGLEYGKVSNEAALVSSLKSFYEPSQTGKVLEIFTDPETNQRVYKELKKLLNERIEN